MNISITLGRWLNDDGTITKVLENRLLMTKELYDSKRVDKMINEGLFNEVKSIFLKYGESSKALQAIGYKELIPVIKGEYDLDYGVELIKKNSRNYAKRQITFIRHQFPVTFYENIQDLLEILKNE